MEAEAEVAVSSSPSSVRADDDEGAVTNSGALLFCGATSLKDVSGAHLGGTMTSELLPWSDDDAAEAEEGEEEEETASSLPRCLESGLTVEARLGCSPFSGAFPLSLSFARLPGI